MISLFVQHIAFKQSLSRVFLTAQMIIAFLGLPLYLYIALFITFLCSNLLFIEGSIWPLFGEFCKKCLYRFEIGLRVEKGEKGLSDCFIKCFVVSRGERVFALKNAIKLIVCCVGEIVQALFV